VPFFFKIKRQLIQSIARKLGALECKSGQIIYDSNSKAPVNTDMIFILYKGEGVTHSVKNGDEQILEESDVFGRVNEDIVSVKITSAMY
jgi:hypothetical protein